MLQELNHSSLLLMYLANELPPGQRAEFERRLAADPALRCDLQAFAEAIETFEMGMATLDAGSAAASPVALRRIGLAMRSHLARQAVTDTPKVAAQPRAARYPWWLYPAAAAAAVLVICLSWWGHQPTGKLVLKPLHQVDRPGPIVAQTPAADDEKSVADSDDADTDKEALKDVGENLTQPHTSIASLQMAEEQISELSHGSFDPLESNDAHE